MNEGVLRTIPAPKAHFCFCFSPRESMDMYFISTVFVADIDFAEQGTLVSDLPLNDF